MDLMVVMTMIAVMVIIAAIFIIKVMMCTGGDSNNIYEVILFVITIRLIVKTIMT